MPDSAAVARQTDDDGPARSRQRPPARHACRAAGSITLIVPLIVPSSSQRRRRARPAARRQQPAAAHRDERAQPQPVLVTNQLDAVSYYVVGHDPPPAVRPAVLPDRLLVRRHRAAPGWSSAPRPSARCSASGSAGSRRRRTRSCSSRRTTSICLFAGAAGMRVPAFFVTQHHRHDRPALPDPAGSARRSSDRSTSVLGFIARLPRAAAGGVDLVLRRRDGARAPAGRRGHRRRSRRPIDEDARTSRRLAVAGGAGSDRWSTSSSSAQASGKARPAPERLAVEVRRRRRSPRWIDSAEPVGRRRSTGAPTGRPLRIGDAPRPPGLGHRRRGAPTRRAARRGGSGARWRGSRCRSRAARPPAGGRPRDLAPASARRWPPPSRAPSGSVLDTSAPMPSPTSRRSAQARRAARVASSRCQCRDPRPPPPPAWRAGRR